MFFGNTRPKSNARAHLKQRKNIVALSQRHAALAMTTKSPASIVNEERFVVLTAGQRVSQIARAAPLSLLLFYVTKAVNLC